jgi:hypothetical protein
VDGVGVRHDHAGLADLVDGLVGPSGFWSSSASTPKLVPLTASTCSPARFGRGIDPEAMRSGDRREDRCASISGGGPVRRERGAAGASSMRMRSPKDGFSKATARLRGEAEVGAMDIAAPTGFEAGNVRADDQTAVAAAPDGSAACG